MALSSAPLDLVLNWYRRYFSDPQAALLAVFLVLVTGVLMLFGNMLLPVLAAIILAYLLEGPVQQLERRRIPRILAVLGVFGVFLALLVFTVLKLVPMLSTQVTAFARQLPQGITSAQALLDKLPQRFPQLVSEQQVREVLTQVNSSITELSRTILSVSLSSIPEFLTFIVYLVLVPFLVFFMLKDKRQIVDWFAGFLPRDRHLLDKVWAEMDDQIGNYVRGKAYEIIILGAMTYVSFTYLGLKYAALLGVLVGLSVLIPFVGAAVVTIPVILAGYLQMGFTTDFAWVVITYTILQTIDGNVLVPVLFSEAVNLHPVAIIVAVLFFGGIWGFWGVFFAIPLATLVKALLGAWPRVPDADLEESMREDVAVVGE